MAMGACRDGSKTRQLQIASSDELVQVAVDPKARVIVAVQAERATGGEGDALVGLIGRARWAGHATVEISAGPVIERDQTGQVVALRAAATPTNDRA